MTRIASVTFVFSLGMITTFLVKTSLARSYVPETNKSIKKLVIDTDAGADDGMAILSLIAAQDAYPKEFQIVAITCSYGNTFLKDAENNVRKLLTIAKRHDIKIYSGATKPLVGNFTSDGFFGKDGFGDFNFKQKITASVDRSMHASNALVQLARTYKGRLTVLSLGPLTNIAIACTLDPDFVNNVDKFHLMGGSVRGVGNMSPGKEFNFFMDPISNFVLFSSVQKSAAISLFPWETVIESVVPKEWRVKILGSYNSSYMNLLNKAEGYMLKRSKAYRPSDSLAALTMLMPQIVTNETLVNVQAVMTGEAKGSLMVDYGKITKNLLNTRIIQAIRVDVFKNLLIQLLT